MIIICPNCHEAIAGVDIDLPNGRALCRPCGELVLLAPAEPAAEAATRALARIEPTARIERYRPDRLDWHELRDGATWRFELAPRRKPAVIPLLLEAVMLAAVSLSCIAMCLQSNPDWTSALLVLSISIPAMATSYPAVKRIMGRFHLSLGPDRIEVIGSRLVSRRLSEPLANIERFTAGGTAGLKANGAPKTVKMLTRDGRSIVLPLMVDDPDEARFVSDRLNLALTELRTPKTYRG